MKFDKIIIPKEQCTNCWQTLGSSDCLRIAKSFFFSIEVPSGFELRLTVCPHCKSLIPSAKFDSHLKNCVFLNLELTLVCAGWTTPLAEQLRRQLRSKKSVPKLVLATLYQELLSTRISEDDIIVPIPLLNRHLLINPLWEICQMIRNECDYNTCELLKRDKRQSTRSSTSERRKKIAEQEYRIVEEYLPDITNKNIFLVDDNVTSGITITTLASKILNAGARLVTPIVLDRHISPRVQQRLALASPEYCPYQIHPSKSKER